MTAENKNYLDLMMSEKTGTKTAYITMLLLTFLLLQLTVAAETQNVIPLSAPVVVKHWQYVNDNGSPGISNLPPDSCWKPILLNRRSVADSKGSWILRTNVLINDTAGSDDILGLFPTLFISAYEIYWDSILVLKNGNPASNPSVEKEGSYNLQKPLPRQMINSGMHQIIIKLSDNSKTSGWRWYYGVLIVAPYDSYLKAVYQDRYLNVFNLGILLIAFLFNIFLYFARQRKTAHLLFSLLCLFTIVDSCIAHFPVYFSAATTYVGFEYYAYTLLSVSVSILFPLFFLYHFDFNRKLIVPVIVINIITAVFFSTRWNIYDNMTLSMLVFSSLIIGWALIKRHEESIIVAAGIVAVWVAYYFIVNFNLLASIMVICTSFSVARQFALKEKAVKESQLRSAHLETELLKKNINPHFLLNSLTSIIVWLRRDPPSAIKLIEALAEEFRMVTQISPLKLIPLRQEIELCKAHLKIMNFRKGADFQLTTGDLPDEIMIPPMIFHTLIENGLTHGFENKTEGTFNLNLNRVDGLTSFTLSNNGDLSEKNQPETDGFGIKYIKGRLEESFPGNWKFQSTKTESGWQTIIEIRVK